MNEQSFQARAAANQTRRIRLMGQAVRLRPNSPRWLAMKEECARLSAEYDQMVAEWKKEQEAAR